MLDAPNCSMFLLYVLKVRRIRWVTAIDDFLMILFPKVHEGKMHAKNNYCKYDDRYLQLLTSSLYLAALVSSCAASKVCSKLSQSLQFFLARAALRAAAQLLWMLLIGRVLLRICVGFGNEA
ncbi:sugar transport protein 8-like [Gossypium hirsutum]|uniref:Sugar transport protein 8-like n=1 Tax=Gossypium hirsutum TaxID=3635 RepID=A0A1U8ITB9_GOSHI|nr:sugar transport protein 8-like [Gossypium hirsutum]